MLIEYELLKDKYLFSPTNVLHIGAHTGEERETYIKLGCQKLTWVEANPELAKSLTSKTAQLESKLICEEVHCAAIADHDGIPLKLQITNNLASSSLKPLKSHSEKYPEIRVVDEIFVETVRADTLLANTETRFDFVNIDIQGCELEALKGFGDRIHDISWLYLEINREELYSGSSLVWEVDRYLLKNDFTRVETYWTAGNWGDAFYIRHSPIRKIEYGRRVLLSYVDQVFWNVSVSLRRFIRRSLRGSVGE